MLDEYDQLTETVKNAIIEVMWVLYNHGITEVHMGGVMRILGVSNKESTKYDNNYLMLDENFAKYMEENLNVERSPTDTLH